MTISRFFRKITLTFMHQRPLTDDPSSSTTLSNEDTTNFRSGEIPQTPQSDAGGLPGPSQLTRVQAVEEARATGEEIRQLDDPERLEPRDLFKATPPEEPGAVLPNIFIDGSDIVFNIKEGTMYGSFSNVYEATFKGKRVALKHLRKALDDEWASEFKKHALSWRDLDHPNVLAFLGIDKESFHNYYCMVLPWMAYGNVNTCMNTLDERSQSIPYSRWLLEIATGLAYLHSKRIVHGDLRGVNILIDNDLVVHVADFEMDSFDDSASIEQAGKVRWLCPAYVKTEIRLADYACDVYSYGCVCVEIYSRKRPYENLKDMDVLLGQLREPAIIPDRPTGQVGMQMPDQLWDLVRSCWNKTRKDRPSAAYIENALRALEEPST